MSNTRITATWILALMLPATGLALADPPGIDGACCLNDGGCVQASLKDCTNLGGSWSGPGTFCPPSPVILVDRNQISIPDADPAGISRALIGPVEGQVIGVSVGLVVTHTFVGDLCVSLEHEGRLVPLIRRPGAIGDCYEGPPFGCSSNDYDITLSDFAMDGPIEDACGGGTNDPTPPGTYLPAYPLNTYFEGVFADGPWTLHIADNAANDVGTLVSWTLTLEVTSPICCSGAPGPQSDSGGGCSPGAPKACCLPSGLCTTTGTEMDCMMAGGHVISEGGFPLCLQCYSCKLPGACCYFDGEQACTDAGGTSKVSYTEIDNYGACCFDSEDEECCRRLDEDECLSEGGVFLGLTTDCLDCRSEACDDADINMNCHVEFQDLLALLAGWSPAANSCVGCAADIDGDDDVDFQDLLLLLAAWGPCL